MKSFYTCLALLFLGLSLSAQQGPDYYRSAQNPYYWKNRKPHAAYWQQDIYYNIKAEVSDSTDIIDGYEELSYWNNSPDTLHFVYFHLYQNAFIKGGHLESLNRSNKFFQRFGPYEAAGKGTSIESLSSDHYEGTDSPIEFIDFSVMKVKFSKPLLPGASAQFRIKFKTYFDSGEQRRRMKKFNATGSQYKHYDGVHWYPRICVYDAKFGWDTYQHLGKEFYGDFGAYDVELRFPNHYIMDATGVLQNRAEVLPPSLREQLDIKNFARKPIGSAPSDIIKRDGSWKTWKFHADNVHDFAWTADPTYRIGEASWNGIQCIALAQESNAAGWQEAAAFTARVIELYSKDFGLYAYPKMIVADARDGMEYPMLTLDGGIYPGYHGVIAHEIGHNWFFGMVGNNETYRAALDEGFTQFLTAWSLRKLDGEYALGTQLYNRVKSKYHQRFDRDNTVLDNNVYLGYLKDAMNKSDAQLNTHSDDFGSALGHGGGYGHVYYKTATMLYNLQYVLGDSLFLAAMQHYFNQWKIAHPYFDDFRNSVIQFTHVDLNWFFDQWMETTKRIDYSVGKVHANKDGSWSIHLKRKGEMQMPVDLAVITEQNDTLLYTIPNTYFAKKDKHQILPQWYGWGMLNKGYIARVNTNKQKIKDVLIDPSFRLADVNQLNNAMKCKVDFSFDAHAPQALNRRQYTMRWRPDLWYNTIDGVKAGLHLNGHYMNYRHQFAAWAWYNTGLGRDPGYKQKELLNFALNYKTAVDRDLYFFTEAKLLDGLSGSKTGFEKTYKGNRFSIYYKTLYRSAHAYALDYLPDSSSFGAGKNNNSLNLEFEHPYSYRRGNGRILLGLRNASLFSNYDYAWLRAEVLNYNYPGKLEIRTRAFGQYISGKKIAPESQLYLAGGNAEEMMESKYYRSRLLGVDDGYTLNNGTAFAHFAGGLNLRGYNLNPLITSAAPASYGRAGAAANVEIDYDQLLPFRLKAFSRYFKMDSYVFADAGLINYASGTNYTWSKLRADAGLGFVLGIKRWWGLSNIEPLNFRFDFPLYLSDKAGSADNAAFRAVFGISRSF